MRQTNLISTIWKSFYSQALYQDVRQNWRFATLAYLVILVIIYTILVAFEDNAKINKFFNESIQLVTQQMPTGEIINGKMSISQNSPYTINLPNETKNNAQEPFIVFDMHDKIMPNETTAVLIFHSNGYYYKSEADRQASLLGNKPKQQGYHFEPYPTAKNFHFSPAGGLSVANKIKLYLPAVIIVALGLLQLILKLCQAVIYGLITLIFAAICKTRLTYGQAYRLSLVAMTPAFIITALPGIFFKIEHAGLIAFVIELIYLFYAAYSNRLEGNTIQ